VSVKEKKIHGVGRLSVVFLLFILALGWFEKEENSRFKLSVAAFEQDRSGRSCEPWLSSVKLAMARSVDETDDFSSELQSLLIFDRYQESGDFSSAVIDYFGVESLEDLIWSHATNSKDLLEKAIASCVHIFEVDVLGKAVGHDLGSNSDLSIVELPERADYNKLGIKFDVKDIESLAWLLDLVEESSFSGPLLINMDFLSGPNSDLSLREDEIADFAKQTARFPGSILSLGWFTSNGGRDPYTLEMMEEMISLVRKYNLDKHPLTFPINAYHLFLGPQDALNRLLEEFPEATLTIYLSGREDDERNRAQRILDKSLFFQGRIMRDF